MAYITGIIPKQGFEIVRDKIGAILLDELTTQKTRQGSEFPEDINIYSEALPPQDSSEQVTINVLLDSATYGQITQKDAQGRTLYFIDIYSSGRQTSDTTGSQDSAYRRDKFLGMCMFIFRSAYYRTMDLPPGTIGGVYVESFATTDPIKKEDSDYTSFARIQLAVRIQEDAQAWTGINLIGNDTTVNLNQTTKGFKFVFNS